MASRAAIERDDGGAGIDPLDGAADQLALLRFVLVEDAVALGLADLLDHHLLGGLGGDAAEHFRVDRLFALLGDDFAVGPVDVHDDDRLVFIFAGDAGGSLGGQLQRRFDAFEDHVFGDIAIAVHHVHEPKQFVPVHRHNLSIR